jgi:hypothetical protein
MKQILITLLVYLTLALSACAGTPFASEVASTAVAGQNSTSPLPAPAAAAAASVSAALDTTYESAAPVEMQLLVGTLSLTGDPAVTKEQASTLLPLWNDLKTISMGIALGQGQANATPQPQSTNAETQARIDALVSQIQAGMTAEQLKAIAAMKLTPDSAMTILQALGITMGGGQPGNGIGQPPQGAPAGTPPGGQAPSGSQPPSDGQPTSTGQQPGNDQMPAGGGMIPPELFDAVIQALGGPPSAAASAAGSAATTGTSASISAAYTQTGGTETKTGGTYTAIETDQSAIYVTGGAALTLTGATIATSGDTSSADNSSFHGLNAAVLAAGGSMINLSDSTITTSGTGANGAFATDAGAAVNLTKVSIKAAGDGGHAVMATNGGVMTLADVDMNTAGPHSGAIATDRGGGAITVTGGSVITSGQDSPGIYSTGDITVTGATITATGAESAVIEGANTITLVDTDLSSSLADKWGVMIYQSMSGDAQGTEGVFTMTGGSLANTAATGPLFYVNNSTGVITLKGVKVTAASGTLVDASANSRWGNSGSNGGNVILTADGQTLSGDMTADKISTVTATLQNGSTLTGAIDTAHTAKAVNLTLDATSSWGVTADSYLTCLSDTDGILGTTVTNFVGNGHTVYYDTSACPALGGKTYTLNGAGTLMPTG